MDYSTKLGLFTFFTLIMIGFTYTFIRSIVSQGDPKQALQDALEGYFPK